MLLQRATTCDLGIALFPAHSSNPNMRSMWGASNKAYDYMAAGLPLLVTGGGDWEVACVTTGIGRPCNPQDAQSIAVALDWFAEHRLESRRMGSEGLRRVKSEWNYDVQFRPVLDAIIHPWLYENYCAPQKRDSSGKETS